MNNKKTKLQGGQFAVWLASKHFPINFALTARLRGSFTPDQFDHALGRLRLRYPPLSMRVTEESDGNAYLISDAELEFPVRSVERKHPNNWVEEVAAELLQEFDLVNNPPVRFVWLRGEDISEIIFVCPHALADGFSVAYLVRDFLFFLGNPDTSLEPMPLIPAMSVLIPDFPGKNVVVWRAKIKAAMIRLFLGRVSKQDQQRRANADPVRPKFNLRSWELTSVQTSVLVDRCHTEGTTVHTALSAAFLRAFGEFFGGGWNRKIQSPTSLRERLTSPVGEAFGLFVNLVEMRANCSPERDFWEVSREIKQRFSGRSDDRHVFRSLIEANVIMDKLGAVITPQTVAQSVTKVDYDLSITNLGRLDFPIRYGPLQLEALYGPSLGGNPEDVVLGVITIKDKLHFTLSFTDVRMTVAQAEQIIEIAMNCLANATDW